MVEGGPDSADEDDTDAALADLRERYARGEITDAEFERRVERLLETESVDDAETFFDGRDAGRRERDRERV
ncbi:hypothetical protein BRC64_06440 [Halobacteriales archaeon QH_10_67_22]|nr:MAG: hypothetical protein BRC64_06440 [Halobacteriales archaeon QH_10_67_22]